jgi:hypothetical protein
MMVSLRCKQGLKLPNKAFSIDANGRHESTCIEPPR